MTATAPQSLYAAQEKIYPREVDGVFARLRIVTVIVLLGGYYLAAWIRWDGRQALLFDLPARKFYVLGLVLWPQDFFFLSWLLIIAALSLFFFTALAGRLWCGYACPQTVWTEAFLWMERLFEGRGPARRKLDAGPWNANKAVAQDREAGALDRFRAVDGLHLRRVFHADPPARHRGAALVARRLGDVLDPVLRVRDLRQRRLHARASLQVHVSLRAFSERDVRSRHAGRVLRSAPRRAARLARSRQRPARAVPRRLHRLPDVRAGVPDRHRHSPGPAVRVHRLRRLHRRVRRRHGQDEVSARADPLLDAARDRRARNQDRAAAASSFTRRC